MWCYNCGRDDTAGDPDENGDTRCFRCNDILNSRLGSQYLHPRKRNAPADKHVPNKSERRELTRLMQTSGMTEEEVRASKALRKASR